MNYNKELLNISINFLKNRKKEILNKNQLLINKLIDNDSEFKKINNDIKNINIQSIIFQLKNKNQDYKILNNDKYIQLLNKRKNILDKNNIDTKFQYLCKICNDKFFIENKICSCLEKIYINEQKKQISKIINCENMLFENFNFSYYKINDDKHNNINISPLENIKYNYKQCNFFCKNFNKVKNNLFLFGESGLGKTFLSLCIANFLVNEGFYVYYDTSINICNYFENQKFNNNINDSSSNINNCYKADLLIIDNFGTELITNFTISSMYDLIENRINNNLSTIINTNLFINDIFNKYSQSIYSRINGNFLHLRFFGQDIRKQNKLK